MGVLYVSGREPSFVVGRDPKSDMVLSDPSVSRRHLVFVNVTNDVAVVEVCGTNGAVVGGEHVKRGYRGYVRTGDRIVAGRYDIVWAGSRENDINTFIRCASKLCEPEAGKVEIEAPPQRKVPEKPSVMLAAGPALTMAIPIVLGAGRGIAVLSSVFAAMWAAFNVIGRARKLKTEEKRRKNAYMTYLSACEEEIRRCMKEVNITLNRVYPAVGLYLKSGVDPFLLWNRMAEKDGALSVRTGIGTVKNPVTVCIPKDRFAAIDDSLRELPGQLKEKYDKLSSSPVLIRIGGNDIPAFVVEDEKGRQMLSAAILQLAVNFPPDELCIMLKLRKDTMRYYIWTRLLPHFMAAEDDDMPAGSVMRVLITDDVSFACRSLSEGVKVIVAGYSKRDIPDSICTVQNRSGGDPLFKPDMIPGKLCFSYAGRLSALWGAGSGDDTIPETVPLGALFEGDISAVIELNYENNDITEHIAAPVGLGRGGKKIFLDLHEKASGPHGLIAGTTGSGKSELLTTMILSFSMCFPPEKLAFFLIDYKGGGMSNLFNELPHLLGSISNLSKSCSRRAMTALRSENIRRQKIFAEAGVNNINDYTRLYDTGAVSEPLPHILIIVDEFAELRKEEPDFMDALISISQVGRSLGMHLILATQKPTGVVDDKIRSNSAFRIALRLVDRTDSMDMLRRPDAVTIKERGRAYLQVGNDDIFECFQSGYAMGHVEEGAKAIHIYRDLLLEEEIMTDTCTEKEQSDKTTWYDLCLRELISKDMARNRPKAAKLWLPDLPCDIYDDKAFLVFDDPYRQRYEKITYDIEKLGNVITVGRTASGKSELLLTVLDRIQGSAAVYIIDYGGGRLKEISENDWCGGYIGDDHPQDIGRMTGFIGKILSDRRRSGTSLPAIMLILDDMPSVLSDATAEAAEHIMRILTLGRSAGIYVAATSVGVPAGRIYDLFDTKLFMGNDDPYAISCFLGQPMRDIPYIRDCPGRGIGVRDGVLLEFQAVRAEGGGKSPPGGVVAKKYPEVPDDPSLEEFMERAVREFAPGDAAGSAAENAPEYAGTVAESISRLPAGYDIKTGELYCLPLSDVNCILVTGRPYSGKHTFLFNISVTAARYGIECMRALSYDALISACRGSEKTKIVITDSMTSILSEFYSRQRSAAEEDELASYLENPVFACGRREEHPVIVAVIENEARRLFSGRKVFGNMICHPYGISFGGCLDENRIFDFSYLPFSTTQISQSRCFATILKYDEKSYSGNIKIPGKINVDNSENARNKG